MGLFSGEKIVAVASTVYNMAGEEKDRPQFLQSLLIRNIFSGTKDSIADTLRIGYLNGPSIRIRQFFKWARKPEKFGTVGMPTGSIANGSALTPTAVEPYIPASAGEDIWCQHALVGVADISYWAEEYVMEHRPAELDTAWIYDYNKSTNKITIRFTDTSTVLFTPTNFIVGAYYLYAYYIIVTGTGATLAYSDDELYIYRKNTGKPPLDALINTGSDYGEFFPFIPIRIENQFITPAYHPDVYIQNKKAYKQVTGQNLDVLMGEIADNPQIGDIDHAYIVFGVSLNVVEMACKRYLYLFFQKLQFSQSGGPSHYASWLVITAEEQAIYNTWIGWKADYDGGDTTTSEPPRPTMSQLAKNEIKITGNSPTLNAQYDIRIQWSYIADGTGSGLGRPGARMNDCWLQYMGEDVTYRNYYTNLNTTGTSNNAIYQKFRIYWQRSPTLYTYLDVIGMQHKNFIYDGKSVDISTYEALTDPDESGFIIPLHYETWREMAIIDSSQMGTACIFIVFNSYQVKKTKWYQSGIFRIFLVIIIAIVSVVFTGGAGIGLLGAHLSVGSALGFTGLTAAIVGSVVNALAALVLTTILEKVANLFGIMGPVIAAILGIFVGGVISSFQAGTGFVFDWNTLFRADNLLKLTDAVGGSVQKLIQLETIKVQEEAESYNKYAEAELKKIEEAYVSEFGYGAIDLSGIARADSLDLMQSESVDTFLARTQLLGSDIAEMSQDIIHNFGDYSLKLPDAFV